VPPPAEILKPPISSTEELLEPFVPRLGF